MVQTTMFGFELLPFLLMIVDVYKRRMIIDCFDVIYGGLIGYSNGRQTHLSGLSIISQWALSM